MRVKLFSLVLLGAIFFPLIAMSQDVSYNYAQDVNFAQFKTYRWVNVGDDKTVDQLAEKEIKQAIDAQLINKGLIHSEDDAQLLIAYQVIITQEKQITIFNTGGDWIAGPGWGFGPGWGYGYPVAFAGGPSISTATTSTIRVGNLILYVYDAGKKDLVWRGEVSKTMNPGTNPDKNRKNLNKAVAKLFKYYPPKPKK